MSFSSWFTCNAGNETSKTYLINIVLHDRRPSHRHRTSNKSSRNTFQWCEPNPSPPQRRINKDITNRDENDKRERVKVRKNVIGKSIRDHRRRLRSQVIVDLVISEPYSPDLHVQKCILITLEPEE